MRVLRATAYAPDLEPITVVAREDDLLVPIAEAAEGANQPGAFILADIFEMEDGTSIFEATTEAMRRQAERDERERSMALLYYYDAAQLPRLTRGGTLTATLPAPLSAEEIETTFKQLALHPEYRNQLVVAIAEDLRVVSMRDGDCKIERVV